MVFSLLKSVKAAPAIPMVDPMVARCLSNLTAGGIDAVHAESLCSTSGSPVRNASGSKFIVIFNKLVCGDLKLDHSDVQFNLCTCGSGFLIVFPLQSVRTRCSLGLVSLESPTSKHAVRGM
jgi:hypothetical protein